MNLQQMSRDIILNGGITYSLTYGNPSKGYAVCIDPDRSEVIPVSEFNNIALQNFINLNSDLLCLPDKYVGAWVHNNNVHLDVTTQNNVKYKAIGLGKECKQLAIYDLKNAKTIWL